jgi:sec-independent protein translocase protein TatA
VFHLGAPEIIGLVLLGLLLFGANRLPQVMRAAGEGIKEFKKASREIFSEVESVTPPKPAAPKPEETKTEEKPS